MSRYEERLTLLERMAARLDLAGVPCRVKRFTPNGAPGCDAELWIPALIIGGAWRSVRVLYWSSVPMFVYPDSVTRHRTDEAGFDHLASLIVSQWHERRSDEREPGAAELAKSCAQFRTPCRG